MCGREFVCGGLVGRLVWGAGGGLTAEQKMTVVLSVPVVWFGPGSLAHVGKTSASTTLPPSFKTDAQKKLTVPFFLLLLQ